MKKLEIRNEEFMVSKETKISLVILFVGVVGSLVYLFWPASKPQVPLSSTSAIQQEKIILPKYDISIYRKSPEVQSYIKDLKDMVSKGAGVLPLDSSELDRGGEIAQRILLKDAEFLKDTRSGDKILHNDMMRILPAPVSSLNEESKKICSSHKCYQAEKYNFVTNTTTRAIVDVDDKKVLSVQRFDDTQPDISHRLKKIAESIALNAPEVKAELGHTPAKKDITMANVRGSMKESPCENTMHLCVAPTFADTKKEQALWAVVDLTDLRLAAAKWAGLGKTTTPACISERSLENRYIMENYCQKDNHLSKNGWDITYHLTPSDGLEIRDVKYKGKPVLRSAKIVDWHVAYEQKSGGENLDTSTPAYMDGRRIEYVRGENGAYMFGYNDAMGCPMFSTSVVLAFNGPQIRELKDGNGFMLTQDFRNPKWPMACNYRYENRFEFYNDGSFRVVAVNKGRGCGDTALYRPVMRIDLGDGGGERFYSRDHNGWKRWEKEGSEQLAVSSEQLATSSEQGAGSSEQLATSSEQGAGSSEQLAVSREQRAVSREQLATSSEGYGYKVVFGDGGGYFVEPNRGQFGDGSRGDHANLFVTKYKEAEGDKDMLTLGSCCKLDEDGPERFLDGESIQNEHLVIWYIPHIHNDDREGHEYCWADSRIGDDGNLHVQIWPCVVGPKFHPIKKSQK